MDKDVIEITELPEIRHAHRTIISLDIDPSSSIEDFLETGEDVIKAVRTGEASHWWVGDYVNFGEKRYGETYAQALESTDYTYEQLVRYTYVCRNVPPENRVHGVSMSVHYVVARLPPTKQRSYLLLAKKENLSDKAMRDFLNEKEPNDTKRGRPPKPKRTFEAWLDEYFTINGFTTQEPKDGETHVSDRIINLMRDAWDAARG